MSNRVLVVHLGKTGMSFVRHFVEQGWQVDIVDERASPPEQDALHEEYPQLTVRKVAGYEQLSATCYDKVAVSSGIALSRLPAQLPLCGDLECFLAGMRQARHWPRLVCITGTNGKSTVAHLVTRMIQSAGSTAEAVGNIGRPLLDALGNWRRSKKQPDCVVAELSSFQLAALNGDLNADVACLLNVAADHLDWHGSLSKYAAAKAKIYTGATIAIYNTGDAISSQAATQAKTQIGVSATDAEVCWQIKNHKLICRDLDLAPLPCVDLLSAGIMPDLACAALTIAGQIMPEHDCVSHLDYLRKAEGLPHRFATIERDEKLVYVDDSKATNVAATVAALNALDKHCVLIAGGVAKGQSFDELNDVIATKARAVILIGQDASLIAQALKNSDTPVSFASDMQSAVELAHAEALRLNVDYVLLSPACASTDQFSNYAARGMAFRRAVTTCIKHVDAVA